MKRDFRRLVTNSLQQNDNAQHRSTTSGISIGKQNINGPCLDLCVPTLIQILWEFEDFLLDFSSEKLRILDYIWLEFRLEKLII